MYGIAIAGLLFSAACGQVNLPPGFEIVDFAVSDDLTGTTPDINECGQIVFDKKLNNIWAHFEVFLYDNGNIFRMTENNEGDVFPRINNAGTIAWSRGAADIGITKIMVYERGSERVFDEHNDTNALGSINDAGHIAWSKDRTGGCVFIGEIYYWNGSRKQQISYTDFIDQTPEINDDDWIAWGRSNHCVYPWEGHVELYRQGEVIPLPTGSKESQVPSINNSGQVAWFSYAPFYGIELWENGQTRAVIPNASNVALNNLGDMYFLRWYEDERTWAPWLYVISQGEPAFYRLADERPWNIDGRLNDWGEAAWHWTRDPYRGDWHGGVRFLRRVRTGDSEFDGDVELSDYAALSQCLTGPDWDELFQRGPEQTLCECRFLDFDYDGDVDLGDFARFQNAFQGD